MVVEVERFSVACSEKNSPKILGRAPILVQRTKGRVYFHEFGFSGAYLNLSAGAEHLSQVLFSNPHLLYGTDFFLAGLWGDKGDKMIDFFRYSGLKGDWPGNPKMSSYVFRNRVSQPHIRDVTCEDGLIVLGTEGKHRRTTASLDEFLKSPPVIEGLRNE